MLPVSAASRHWQKMVKHKGVNRESCGAVDAGVSVTSEYHKSAAWVIVIVPLVLLLNFDGCRMFLIYELSAGGNVARQMNRNLVCSAALPVDSYAIVLEQIR